MMDERFARVPIAAAATKLGARALRVLIAIAAHADRNGAAFPSLARIAELTGIDRRGIPIEVTALVRSGFLLRQSRASENGVNRYTVVLNAGVTCQGVTPDMRGRDRVTRQDMKGDTSGRALTDHKQTIEQFHARRVAREPALISRDYAGDFEMFWQIYPHRGEHSDPKKPAQLKFEAAVKGGVDPDDIIAGAERYRAHVEQQGTEPRYRAQAQTWLNQERWALFHEPEPPRLRVGMN